MSQQNTNAEAKKINNYLTFHNEDTGIGYGLVDKELSSISQYQKEAYASETSEEVEGQMTYEKFVKQKAQERLKRQRENMKQALEQSQRPQQNNVQTENKITPVREIEYADSRIQNNTSIDIEIDQRSAPEELFNNPQLGIYQSKGISNVRVPNAPGFGDNTVMSYSENISIMQSEIPPMQQSQVNIPPFPKERQPRKYQSRAHKNYADENSQDESGDENEIQIKKKEPKITNATELFKSEMKNMLEKKTNQLFGNPGEDVYDFEPNKRFKHFNEMFSNLTKSKNVITMYPIITCVITYNSKSVVTVTKKSDREYYVQQYSLESYQMTMIEMVGGKKDSFIKAKDIQQNDTGDQFALVYIDDGIFKLRTFGTESRTQTEIEKEELNINEVLGLDNHTIPISNFPEPFSTCVFINNDLIFVQLFHNKSLTHIHFFYTRSTRKMSELQRVVMQTQVQNFPYACFYNEQQNVVYSFYRQGESFRIPVLSLQDNFKVKWREEDMPFIRQTITQTDQVLGQMFLINGHALVTRSSSQILFYKLITDPFTNERKWTNYRTLEHRGFIYFIKGNKRLQVTTDANIYFYLIDPFTFEPQLENVMFNFNNCTQMMFGSKVRYCVTFKTNQKSFDIHRRKFEHNFNCNVIKGNFDSSTGLAIESMNAFLVGKYDEVRFFDINTYKEIKENMITIPLIKSDTREPAQIISMQISVDENTLAVISGKNLIMNEQKINQLFIFSRVRNKTGKMENFTLQKRIILKENPVFEKISMQFIFKNVKIGQPCCCIYFAKREKIIELNYLTSSIREIVIFEVPLCRQPEFFLMNDNQTISIIASQDDGIYYNHSTRSFKDLDDKFKISNIKEIIHDHEEGAFYILANKYHEKLGLFLIKFDEHKPMNHKFILKWKNKLDIADADVNIIREGGIFKELVVSFKTIFMNTYCVQVIDISRPDQKILFRHETFQLWESQITGFFLHSKKDFITINRDGINVLTLQSGSKRQLIGDDGQEKMMHCLESTSYLKVAPSNFIYFDFAQDTRVINVMQQFTRENSKTGDEDDFELIYKVRVHEITLRELLLFQSFYVCRTQSDILKLVQSQPYPEVFYKTFLELDGTNMVSILAFDNKSMKQLLSDKYATHFQSDYPIFYKNKIQKSNNKNKFFYRSAVDSALRNNQIRACSYILQYIVKYQNNYVSSFLFGRNLPTLMEKGVKVSELFQSKIFCFNFDFDGWLSSSTDNQVYMRPYNDSIFNLRTNYKTVFPEANFHINPEDESVEQEQGKKVYKVSYKLNILPVIGEHIVRLDNNQLQFKNEGISLMDICIDSGELGIFETEMFIQLISFRWTNFAFNLHLRGCLFHFFYVACLFLYIDKIYIYDDDDHKWILKIILSFGIVYPTFYELFQAYRQGLRSYLSDFGNISDITYFVGGIGNLLLQYFGDACDVPDLTQIQKLSCEGSYQPFTKILMTTIQLQMIIKTFFFLRIFDSLSYIVTMLRQVIVDLRVFLMFYFILIVLFGMIFAVIGVANVNLVDSGFAKFVEELPEDFPDPMPMEEYKHIGLFFGYIINTLRISLGDDGGFFFASQRLTFAENMMFWMVWFVVVFMTCIVFLNFIIAEVSNSYQGVKDNLNAMKNKEKASLISEAECMTFDKYKDEKMFPKYFVIRSVDS